MRFFRAAEARRTSDRRAATGRGAHRRTASRVLRQPTRERRRPDSQPRRIWLERGERFHVGAALDPEQFFLLTSPRDVRCGLALAVLRAAVAVLEFDKAPERRRVRSSHPPSPRVFYLRSAVVATQSAFGSSAHR